jgi:hypothetical protein
MRIDTPTQLSEGDSSRGAGPPKSGFRKGGGSTRWTFGKHAGQTAFER